MRETFTSTIKVRVEVKVNLERCNVKSLTRITIRVKSSLEEVVESV